MRFHDLRHTAASYLAMNQASLLEIGTLLGHKTVQMTKRYAHLSNAHMYSTTVALNEKLFNSRK
ncbi:MAG: tyrosine-type recombinase/integrase [Simkania sp.]|nr:tyrosine-type recombinase/integrase [Simkania sp.]